MMDETVFDDNRSTYGYGGALSLVTTDTLISGSTFSSNSSYYDGGALYSSTGSDLSVSASSFRDNGTTYGSGGALYQSATTYGASDLDIESTDFSGNSAGYHGGALAVTYTAGTSVSRSSFQRNSAGGYYYGGAIYAYYTTDLEVDANQFCANTAAYGGAVYGSSVVSSTQDIANNVFVENEATASGGALYSYSLASLDILNNTLVGNEAGGYGGGWYALYTSAEVTNNIVAYSFDGDGVYAADSASASGSDVTYNDWYVNTTNDRSGYFTFSTTTGGNHTGAPGFVSYSADGDCDNDDLTLAAGSANIDVGHPAHLDPDGTVSDIGAYGGGGASAWDADGDGYIAGSDCDDDDAAVNPGAVESCNGVDDDCDGSVDVAAVDAVPWYADADGDGYGDPAVTTDACDEPTGYVSNADDCDDADASSSPAGTETPYDGVDQDCDGADLTDVDGDGYDAAAVGGSDCDDNDADVYPGTPDAWYDGVDSDCDGASDFDADGDGHDDLAYGGDDCNDADANVHVGAVEGLSDGVDQDCDGGELCGVDADGDGYRRDALSTVASIDLDCDDPGEATAEDPTDDCNDADATVYPGARETPGDDIDQDCDGEDEPIHEDTDQVHTGEGADTGDTGEDTATSDTDGSDDSGNAPDDDKAIDITAPGELQGGCGCATPAGAAAPAGLLALAALAVARRRRG